MSLSFTVTSLPDPTSQITLATFFSMSAFASANKLSTLFSLNLALNETKRSL